MGILIQAMRAVFIEMLGVILVLWLLFGGVTWTLESAGGRRSTGPVRALLATVTRTHLTNRPQNSPGATEEVSKRLDHYSRAYGRAATGYLKQVTQNLTSDLSQRERL